MGLSFKDMMFAFVLTGLFFFAFVNFAILFSSSNNSNQSLLDNPSINRSFNDFSSNITNSKTLSQEQRDAFESDTPSSQAGDLTIGTLFKTGITFASSIVAFFNIIFSLIFVNLQISIIVIGAMITLLMASIVFLAWRLYKTGS